MPAPVLSPAKHADKAAEVEDEMVGTMQELRVAAVERNAALAEELDAIGARREAAVAVLAQEEPRRVVDFTSVQNAFKLALKAADTELSTRIAAMFDAHRASLVPVGDAIDRIRAEETRFYEAEIPAVNERQCGESIRGIQTTRESVQLDNQTVGATRASPDRQAWVSTTQQLT
jgi:hypothetical protein